MDITFMDVLWVPVLVFLSYAGAVKIGHRVGVSHKMSVQILLYHSIFCLIYIWYSLNFASDVNRYVLWAEAGEYVLRPGKGMVTAFTAIFIEGFGMSRTSAFIPFNFMGTIALIVLYSVLRPLWCESPNWRRFIPSIIVFLPGFSFWSSAIGKDAPAFLGTCLAVFAMQSPKRRWPVLLLGFCLAFAVRPYFGLMIGLAVTWSIILGSGMKMSVKIFVAGFFGAISLVVFPFVLREVGLDQANSIVDLNTFIQTRAGYNQFGGGSVDISSMSFPMQLFTYLFRPLFFDARNIFQIEASVESLVLLLIVGSNVKGIARLIFRDRTSQIQYSSVLFLVGWIMFSQITANLGISVRQKTMILPPLLVLAGTAAQLQRRRRKILPIRSLQSDRTARQ